MEGIQNESMFFLNCIQENKTVT